MDDCKPLPAPVAPRVPIAREDPEFTASQPWNIKQETLRNFQSLPRELRDRIFSLACTLRPLQTWPGTDFSPLAVDIATTRTLALVCRSCYRLAVEFLYRRISIRHPSALSELQHALAIRPNLGRLVQSLHVGPTDDLPQNWWPVQSWSINSVQLTTALLGGEFGHRRPGWCEPRHRFEVPYDPQHEHYQFFRDRLTAVSDAIEAAAQAVDVDLRRVNRNCSRQDIGTDIYTIRVFEVQAATELFLMEARRRHGLATGCGPDGASLLYPRLAIAGLSPAVGNDDVFWVTRSQLRSHIARRGAMTDHFSHPLIFARSGISWTAVGADGEPQQGGSDFNLCDSTIEDAVDVFSLSVTPRVRSARDGFLDVRDDLYFPMPSTATVGGNLALLRAVLAFTPRLKSLSLTGFLERAVVGSRAAPELRNLQSLTVGPQPRPWHMPRHLAHASLGNLRRLRLCGLQLHETELNSIMGEEGALPQLRTLQWSLSPKFLATSSGYTLWETINILLAYDEGRTLQADSTAQSNKRARDDSYDGNERAHPLSIQACLHAEDAKRILTAAAGRPEVRAAWRNGTQAPGYNRFQIFVNRGHDDTGIVEGREKKALREMYEEGKEWWDAGAMVDSLDYGVDERGGEREGERRSVKARHRVA